MSSNAYILDAMVRHQIEVQGYAGHLSGEVGAGIRAFRAQVVKDIEAGANVAELRRAIPSYVRSIGIGVTIAAGLQELAVIEAQYIETLLGVATSADIVLTSPELVYGAVSAVPLHLTSTTGAVTRKTVTELVADFSGQLSGQVLRRVQAGVIQGENTQAIARGVSQLVSTRSRDQAESVVRTAVNHIAAQARDVAINANSQILDGEEFCATLDSRTTFICAGYDGQVFAIGAGPRPPLHYRCRSLRVPRVNAKYGLSGLVGQRPAVGASGTEVVSGSTTYQSFLRRQPAEWQDKFLGPERAALFRAGKVDLAGFTSAQGRTIPLSELTDKDGKPVIQ